MGLINSRTIYMHIMHYLTLVLCRYELYWYSLRENIDDIWLVRRHTKFEEISTITSRSACQVAPFSIHMTNRSKCVTQKKKRERNERQLVSLPRVWMGNHEHSSQPELEDASHDVSVHSILNIGRSCSVPTNYFVWAIYFSLNWPDERRSAFKVELLKDGCYYAQLSKVGGAAGDLHCNSTFQIILFLKLFEDGIQMRNIKDL